MNDEDRRKFPRIKAPVLCRPAGLRFRTSRQAQDISLGGARVYSDEETAPGTRLELELIFAEGESLVAQAEVVWIETLPDGAPARFDVGLRFTQLSPDAAAQLERLLAVED